MNTNVNACMPSDIYINCYPEDGLDWPKYAKTLSHVSKRWL